MTRSGHKKENPGHRAGDRGRVEELEVGEHVHSTVGVIKDRVIKARVALIGILTEVTTASSRPVVLEQLSRGEVVSE